MLICGITVPEAAQEIYSKSATYRQWVALLDQIVQMYKFCAHEQLPVEEPLLEDRISEMDMALAPGCTGLKWKSEQQIPEFIENTMKVVSGVSRIAEVLSSGVNNLGNQCGH